MKNKLTTDEELFQSKLNDAEFTYKDSHWAEMQGKLGANTTATFSPLMKAAVGFLILVGAVALVNLSYSDQKIISPEKQEIVQEEAITDHTHEKSSTIISEVDITEIEEFTKETQSTSKIEKIEVASEPFILIEIQEKGEIELQKEMSPSKNKIIKTKEVKTSFNFVIESITTTNVPCLNTRTYFQLNFPGSEPEGYTYEWLINGKTINGSHFENSYVFLNSGIFEITANAIVNNEIIGTSKTIIEINNQPNLEFNAIDSKDVFTDNHISLDVLYPSEGTYRWKTMNATIPQGESSTLIFQSEGYKDITLEHTSANGCVTANTQKVAMRYDFIEDYPNAFTPNNDRLNDEFELAVFQNLEIKKYKMTIFNIEGKVVFSTIDQNTNWNGKLNNTGSLQPKGTYAWIVEIENNKGFKRLFKGKFKFGL